MTLSSINACVKLPSAKWQLTIGPSTSAIQSVRPVLPDLYMENGIVSLIVNECTSSNPSSYSSCELSAVPALRGPEYINLAKFIHNSNSALHCTCLHRRQNTVKEHQPYANNRVYKWSPGVRR